jgi:hypothetical protein
VPAVEFKSLHNRLAATTSAPSLRVTRFRRGTDKTGDGEGDLATMIDMNGDGLPDRVMEGSSSGQFDVQLNLNGSFSSVVAWNNVVGDGTYLYTPRCRDYSHVYTELMDMNGDGLPDRVLQGVSGGGVQLNNGHGLLNPKLLPLREAILCVERK